MEKPQMGSVIKLRRRRLGFYIAGSVLVYNLGSGLTPAQAQATDALRDSIVVTATKKSEAEDVQSVPLAVTAYGEAQLDAYFVKDISDISFSQPNVTLENINSVGGALNFSIRGLGVNSSIPSIDPAVGVFVDGVYLGITTGATFDTFDLEGIEILRGPQGVLFGRNVTGGAVLINTKRPSDEFEFKAKGQWETGLNQVYQAAVSGPVIPGVLNANISGMFNDDQGWFTNLATGEKFNPGQSFSIRPSVELTLGDSFDLYVRYEHGETEDGHGVGQNRALYDRETFDLEIGNPGFLNQEWDMVTAEANLDVAFGDGTITNIFGWRRFNSRSIFAPDSSAVDYFKFGEYTEQDQISNELRYAGTFSDVVELTLGLYYFSQDVLYEEVRFLFQDPILAPGQAMGTIPGPLSFYGGGIQDHKTYGVFGHVDVALTPTLSLLLGLRYSYEEKSVNIATIVPGPPSPNDFDIPPGACNLPAGDCVFNVNADPAFDSEEDFSALSPKIGFQWNFHENAQTYFHWSRGNRSGGYNLRNTSPVALPGPFDQETIDAFELGMKTQTLSGRATLNAAVYWNTIKDMQREVIFPDPVSGLIQIIANTADARVRGFEVDGQFFVTDNFVLTGFAGHTDAEYTEVLFDITQDGSVDDVDLNLELPRAPKWTFGVGAILDLPVSDIGNATARVNFSHRDRSFYSDNNIGVLSPGDILNASISFSPNNENVRFSVYGKNLLNDVTEGSENPLGFPPGQQGTYAGLNKGRVIGGELMVTF